MVELDRLVEVGDMVDNAGKQVLREVGMAQGGRSDEVVGNVLAVEQDDNHKSVGGTVVDEHKQELTVHGNLFHVDALGLDRHGKQVHGV